VNTFRPSKPYQTGLLVCIRVHSWFFNCMDTAKEVALRAFWNRAMSRCCLEQLEHPEQTPTE
jgi:hypothetical protein